MNGKTVKGLLIEDDSNDADLFMMLMKEAHWPSYQFAFEWAQTLKAGVKILSRGEIDVVLLDVMLPDSSGIESVRKLRSQFPGVPIVVLTGLSDEAMGIEALRNGAQDYQVKGNLDGDVLKRTISYAVERHRALARMGNIIDRSADGIVVVDGKGLVRHINPAAETLFRCESGQLLGKPFPHPLSPDRSAEIRLPGEVGEERTAEMRVSEIEWEDETAKLALIRDITELRRHEQLKAEIKERRRLDKLKDALMNTVSHEMRNPLTIIKIAAHNIATGFKGRLSKHQTEMASIQNRNIERLQKIVERILDLSRLESGATSIQFQRVDAGLIISDTAEGFQLIAKKRGISIRAEIPSDLPPLCADPELVIQLLTNLLDNAMRYARTQITVRAATHAQADVARKQVKISVIDDGKGVPESRQDDLFNKFVQVDRSRKGSGYKGTGLGLAICKEIVERLEGRIWIESSEGRGATFHFILPQDTPTLVANP
jgi:signal transduction histidine kinase